MFIGPCDNEKGQEKKTPAFFFSLLFDALSLSLYLSFLICVCVGDESKRRFMNQKAESCDCVGITRRESKRYKLCMQTEESVFGIEWRIEAVEALHANPRGCFMNRKPNRSSCINNRKVKPFFFFL